MVHGIGLGLRHRMAAATLNEAPPELAWLEIHPENYLFRGGRYEALLADARTRYPLVTHGLSMGFGTLTPFDATYLRALRRLLEDLDAKWHSDHLCFGGVDGMYVHDLLPLPLNQESIDVAVDRIREAQDALGIQIAVEHISFYVTPPGSVMEESDHLNEILERADCKLLLDVNNVFVNAKNRSFDARAFIDRMPMERVAQLHIAGHHVRADGFRIDTHAEPICEGTFALFEYTMHKLRRPIGVLLERDDNFPAFHELVTEVKRLDEIYRRSLALPASVEARP